MTLRKNFLASILKIDFVFRGEKNINYFLFWYENFGLRAQNQFLCVQRNIYEKNAWKKIYKVNSSTLRKQFMTSILETSFYVSSGTFWWKKLGWKFLNIQFLLNGERKISDWCLQFLLPPTKIINFSIYNYTVNYVNFPLKIPQILVNRRGILKKNYRIGRSETWQASGEKKFTFWVEDFSFITYITTEKKNSSNFVDLYDLAKLFIVPKFVLLGKRAIAPDKLANQGFRPTLETWNITS